MAFDLASLAVLLVVLGIAMRKTRLEFAGPMGLAASALLLIYWLLPRVIFDSSYADMRLVPYIFATALIAIRPLPAAGARFLRMLAIAGTAFVFVRAAANTASLWLYDRSYRAELAALDHVPRGARLVSFVGRPCGIQWWVSRLEHLPGLAIERKHAFSNDQWDNAAGQPLTVAYTAVATFARDPSQIVLPKWCVNAGLRPIDRALGEFPRTDFDYVWLIRPPAYDPSDVQGLQPVWRSGTSVLFRVVDRHQPQAGAAA
jgi:hypothetical protein